MIKTKHNFHKKIEKCFFFSYTVCSADYFSLRWWLRRWPPELHCEAAPPSSDLSGVDPSLLVNCTPMCPLPDGKETQRWHEEEQDRTTGHDEHLCFNVTFVALWKGIAGFWRKMTCLCPSDNCRLDQNGSQTCLFPFWL